MLRDDLLIGSLRMPIRELQEMVNYLESRRTLGPDDLDYCRSKIADLTRHLKALRKVADSELLRTAPQDLIRWN